MTGGWEELIPAGAWYTGGGGVWDSGELGKVLQQLFRHLPGEEWVKAGYMRYTATGPRPGNTSGVAQTKVDRMISYRSYAMMIAPWAWQRELFQLWTRQEPPLFIHTEHTHTHCEHHFIVKSITLIG